MSLDHINTLCNKIVQDASSLASRYEASVEGLENASAVLPDNDPKKLIELACLLSRLVQVKKEGEQAIQSLLFLTAYDMKYCGNLGLAKRQADSRAMELLAVARNSLGLLKALILRAEAERTECYRQLEESSSSGKESEAPEVTSHEKQTRREETAPIQDDSFETPTLINKNGIWIKSFNGIHLESYDTKRATTLGRLKRNFDKQCSNIIILEKERNALLHRTDTLELEKLSMEAKYTRMQAEVMELRKSVASLRRKFAADESRWSRRLEVAQLQLVELQTNGEAQDRPNSSANLVSSK